MKAFLLAAGLGTRLRPLTDTIPKCLIPVCEKPLLGWWLDLFRKYGVEEVLINLHHLPEQVRTYVAAQPGDIKIHLVYEERLLGSAGTLRANRWFVEDEQEFLVCYADNLTSVSLADFLVFHRAHKKDFSMALFRAQNPRACGIATIDADHVVTSFTEKPENPRSDLANAGIYLSTPAILDMIPPLPTADIGYHLLPQLVGKMAGWEMDDFLIDVGTMENLQKARDSWPGL
jgi:mannose-1-phosphate guanylyltransferase